jgi:heat shock protein HslJ
MRRILTLSAVLPLVVALAACSPEAQKSIQSGLQTAAPTLKAAAQSAGTQVSSAMQTAGPTLEAAAQSAGTQVSSALQTAQPTLEAAGTQVANAIGTAGPTVQAVGTQVASAIGTAGPTIEAAGNAAAFALASGQTWEWQATQMKDGTAQTPTDPAKYTVKFNSDGTLAVQADCNNGAGTYTLDGSGLTITLGAMTMAACPPGSLDSQFIQELGEAGGFKFEPGHLKLILKSEVGTMEFATAK